MNPSPSPIPSPIPVTVVASPAEWWQVVGALSPFAVLVAAVIAAFVGFNQIQQKREADNRAEWWKRTQWALDAVYSGDDRRGTVGLKVLTVLAGSKLAGQGELDVLEAAWENPLDEAERELKAAAEGIPSEEAFGSPTVVGEPSSAAAKRLAKRSGFRAGRYSPAGPASPEAGVDGEPGPRDNEESDRQDSPEGGAR